MVEEKTNPGPEAPPAAEQLTAARKSLDRFQKAWTSSEAKEKGQ